MNATFCLTLQNSIATRNLFSHHLERLHQILEGNVYRISQHVLGLGVQ